MMSIKKDQKTPEFVSPDTSSRLSSLDLYEDLLVCDSENQNLVSIHEVAQEKEILKQSNKELIERLKAMEEMNMKLCQDNISIKANFDKLLATAKTEITRKNKLIESYTRSKHPSVQQGRIMKKKTPQKLKRSKLVASLKGKRIDETKKWTGNSTTKSSEVPLPSNDSEKEEEKDIKNTSGSSRRSLLFKNKMNSHKGQSKTTDLLKRNNESQHDKRKSAKNMSKEREKHVNSTTAVKNKSSSDKDLKKFNHDETHLKDLREKINQHNGRSSKERDFANKKSHVDRKSDYCKERKDRSRDSRSNSSGRHYSDLNHKKGEPESKRYYERSNSRETRSNTPDNISRCRKDYDSKHNKMERAKSPNLKDNKSHENSSHMLNKPPKIKMKDSSNVSSVSTTNKFLNIKDHGPEFAVRRSPRKHKDSSNNDCSLQKSDMKTDKKEKIKSISPSVKQNEHKNIDKDANKNTKRKLQVTLRDLKHDIGSGLFAELQENKTIPIKKQENVTPAFASPCSTVDLQIDEELDYDENSVMLTDVFCTNNNTVKERIMSPTETVLNNNLNKTSSILQSSEASKQLIRSPPKKQKQARILPSPVFKETVKHGLISNTSEKPFAKCESTETIQTSTSKICTNVKKSPPKTQPLNKINDSHVQNDSCFFQETESVKTNDNLPSDHSAAKDVVNTIVSAIAKDPPATLTTPTKIHEDLHKENEQPLKYMPNLTDSDESELETSDETLSDSDCSLSEEDRTMYNTSMNNYRNATLQQLIMLAQRTLAGYRLDKSISTSPKKVVPRRVTTQRISEVPLTKCSPSNPKRFPSPPSNHRNVWLNSLEKAAKRRKLRNRWSSETIDSSQDEIANKILKPVHEVEAITTTNQATILSISDITMNEDSRSMFKSIMQVQKPISPLKATPPRLKKGSKKISMRNKVRKRL